MNLLGISANTCGINMAEGLGGTVEAGGRQTGRQRRLTPREEKKAAPKDGLSMGSRMAESGLYPAVPIIELDEALPVGAAAEGFFQRVHLVFIARFLKDVCHTQNWRFGLIGCE